MLNRIAQMLLVLLVVFAVFISVMPSLVRMAAVSWLEGQGLEVAIEKIEIDLDEGAVTIIAAQAMSSKGEGFTLDRLHVDIALQPLWEQQLVIEAIELQGLSLESANDEFGLRMIAGIKLPQQEQADQTEDGIASAVWGIQLGDVIFEDIKICHAFYDRDKSYCVVMAKLDWQGSLDFDSGNMAQAEISASLGINNLEFTDRIKDQLLLSNERLSVDGLMVKGLQDLHIDQLTVSGLLLWPGDPAAALIRIDSLQADMLALSEESSLEISSIESVGIGADIVRGQQAQWMLQDKVSALWPVSEDDFVEEDAQAGLKIRLGNLKLTDSHPIYFTDNSLKTPFHLAAQIKALSLTTIDTGDATQSSDLQMHLVIDKHGLVDIEGKIQLLASPPGFDLSGDIKGLDLRPVSSYMEEGLGYRINSGQLNAGIKLLSVDGQLDGLLDLDLKQFKLKSLSKEDADRMQQRMGFPLDTTLNLLRKKDNSIQIKLPVKGDINNPNFDVSDIVFKTTATTMTSVILNYYTPFGLVTAAKGLFDLATALSFEPVLFNSGELTISNDHTDYISNLSKLLNERPQLYVTLCGYSNQDDLTILTENSREEVMLEDAEYNMDDAIKEGKEPEIDLALRIELLNLATSRSESIKALLLEQGIAADRLILCDPEFGLDAIAGVEVSI